MRYSDPRQRTIALLREALPLMAQQLAGLHPLSYALWYEHLAGKNAQLSDAIKTRLSAGVRLTDHDTEWLYDTYIRTQRAEATGQLPDSLRSILHEIVCSARDAGADISRFAEALEKRRQQLCAGLESIAIDAVVCELVGDTQHMQAVTSELAHRLDANAREVATLQSNLKQAQNEALCDALTGLKNRRGFEHEIQVAGGCAAVLRGSSLLFLDIDHFKRVNDMHGHILGDKVLCAVADAMRRTFSGTDLVARLGGEEFAVLLPNTTAAEAHLIAHRLCRCVSQGRIRKSNGMAIDSVTVSIGVAHGRLDDSIDSLVNRADSAMYLAKRAGRNCVTVATDQDRVGNAYAEVAGK